MVQAWEVELDEMLWSVVWQLWQVFRCSISVPTEFVPRAIFLVDLKENVIDDVHVEAYCSLPCTWTWKDFFCYVCLIKCRFFREDYCRFEHHMLSVRLQQHFSGWAGIVQWIDITFYIGSSLIVLVCNVMAVIRNRRKAFCKSLDTGSDAVPLEVGFRANGQLTYR